MRWFGQSSIRRTPLFFQMESVECGAASLGMILGYFGAHYPLRDLREVCGVSRDGIKASTLLKAGQHFGLMGKAQKMADMATFLKASFPCIVFWKFNHFLVVEGLRHGRVYLNDPAMGRYSLPEAEFDEGFTGIVLSFTPGEGFVKNSQMNSWVGRLRFWFKDYTRSLLYLVVTGVLMVLPALLIPALLELFVDSYVVQNQWAWRTGILVAFGVTLTVQAILMLCMRYFSLRLERAMVIRFSSEMMWTLLRLPMRFFAQRFSGDLAARTVLPERISTSLASLGVGFTIQLACTVFYVALMGAYEWRLMLVTLALAIVSLLGLGWSLRAGRAVLHYIGVEAGKLDQLCLTSLTSIHTLKATGRELDFFQQWAGQQAKVIRHHQTLALSNERLDILPLLTQGVVQLFIFGFGGFLAMKGEISLGRLVAFQSLALAFFKPVSDLLFSIHQFQQLGMDLARSEDVLYQAELGAELGPGIVPTTVEGTVELRDVTFGYHRREPALLQNISLVVPAGARVAIIGGSGSGKSTIARLISGLYAPWEGEVLIDGQPLLSLDAGFRSRLIGVVDQDMAFFAGSIRDNLTLWDPEISDEAVVAATKDAELHADISRREGGYDGLLSEGARSLSGGQRQRLEIARVLAREPKILILDEATSALDPVVELAVDTHIRKRGCTTIVIAHRLSTIRDAHTIVVLDKGQIVAMGTHEALMQNAYYAQLVRAE